MGKSTVYEVEEILDCKPLGKGLQFLIKWKGYGENECTWEPERNVQTTEILQAFAENLRTRKHPVNQSEQTKRAYAKVISKWSKGGQDLTDSKFTELKSNHRVRSFHELKSKMTPVSSVERQLLMLLFMWILVFVMILIPVLPLQEMWTFGKDLVNLYLLPPKGEIPRQ